jgi:hypothetical protein
MAAWVSGSGRRLAGAGGCSAQRRRALPRAASSGRQWPGCPPESEAQLPSQGKRYYTLVLEVGEEAARCNHDCQTADRDQEPEQEVRMRWWPYITRIAALRS